MTIKDIAKLSGYSVGTVSRVLNDSSNVSKEARRAITAVVDQYHFNRNTNARYLKQQAASGIAIIVKGAHNMLFAGIMERLQSRIKEHGFASMVHYIDEEDKINCSYADLRWSVFSTWKKQNFLFLIHIS